MCCDGNRRRTLLLSFATAKHRAVLPAAVVERQEPPWVWLSFRRLRIDQRGSPTDDACHDLLKQGRLVAHGARATAGKRQALDQTGQRRRGSIAVGGKVAGYRPQGIGEVGEVGDE